MPQTKANPYASKQTVCLNMIVKDESHIIEKTLSHLLEHIPLTYWVICDTGSSDDTCAIIERFFKERKIKGELHRCEWKGFGKSRTEALNHAYNKTDYLFIFDADDSIHGNFVFPAPLTHDQYQFPFGKGFSYTRPLLVNNRKKWKYVGVLHEYLTEAEPGPISVEWLQGDFFIESGRLGNRNQIDPKLKYEKDAATLEHELTIETDKGLCDRYAFYLAQSYKDCGNVDKAIEWYSSVLERNNWSQEKYFSALQLGQMYNNMKHDFEKAVKYLSQAVEYDEERFDSLILLMELFYNRGMHLMVDMTHENIRKNYHKKNLKNKLFVYTYMYDEMLDFLNVVSCYYSRNLQSGYESIKRIARDQALPQHKMDLTLNNMIFYQEQMKNEPDDKESRALFDNYINILSKKCGTEKRDITANECTIFNLLLEKNKKSLTKYKIFKKGIDQDAKEEKQKRENPEVMITFTTCKRFDLFTQTVNSIMNTWTDVEKVDYWYCVDDNSSETDRTNMQRLYPWMQFYMKTPEEKGHMKSMNLIWDELKRQKPTYWIHMEDDFLFFDKGSYVEKAIRGLNMPEMQEAKVHQMLFNRSYAETIDGYNICSHIYLKEGASNEDKKKEEAKEEAKEISEYCLHFHENDTKTHKDNCHYWPHYSFRPSLIRTQVILELGNFDTEDTFFELTFANKYHGKGYQSAFFNKLTNLHTGRLTKDRHNANIPNAYQLNQTNQFTEKDVGNRQEQLDKPQPDKAQPDKAQPDKAQPQEVHGQIVEGDNSTTSDPENAIKSVVDAFVRNEPDFWTKYSKDECVAKINAELSRTHPEICITSLGLNGNSGNSNENVGPTSVSNTDPQETTTEQPETNKKDDENIKLNIEEINEEEKTDTEIATPLSNADKEAETETKTYIKVVNLKRRPDRKENVEKIFASHDIPKEDYEFVDATDGIALEVTDEMMDIFEGNDFGNRKGVIGCAMSHINLWKQLLEDKQNDYYVIMEDDITLANNFTQRLANAKKEMDKHDLIFFGYHMFDKQRNKFAQLYNDLGQSTQKIVPCNKNLYIGGTFMYSVNKSGAKKLMDYIHNHGVKHGIDYFMKIMPELEIMECQPQMCYSVWNEGGAEIDTDIQNTGVSFKFDRGLVKDTDFVFIPGMDQVNYDCGQIFTRIADLKRQVKERDDCVAFNTLKFLKSNVDELTLSPYFKGNDGIYVKRDVYERLKKENKIPIQETEKKETEKKETENQVQIQRQLTPTTLTPYARYMQEHPQEPPPQLDRPVNIKLIGDWCDPKTLCKEWSVMFKTNDRPENYTWNNMRFVWNDDQPVDYYVIINKPPGPNQYFIPEKTIVFQMEPWNDVPNNNWGVKMWGQWAKPDESRFLKVIGCKSQETPKEHSNAYWQLELTYSQLLKDCTEKKEDTVASICSSKYMDPGHRHRVDFLHYIEERQRVNVVDEDCTIEEPVPLAIFSQTNFGKFMGYRSSLPMATKSRGYMPFKYYFMCENNYEEGYMTEKIWEPILCECLCFYYGCPNIADYLDTNAFVQLDMTDFAKSYAIMERAIREDWWSQRIGAIRREKMRILNEMQFCPRLERILYNYEHEDD